MVRDNPDQSRFELEEEGVTAIAVYRRAGNVVTFTHTEVPTGFRRKGVGSELAQGALDLVRARGERVVPECPFIRKFIERHPAYQDLLVTPL